MAARSWICDFPRLAPLVLNRVEALGVRLPAWAAHVGIDRTNPASWAPGRKALPGDEPPKREPSPMPVEALMLLAEYMRNTLPERRRESAEALVGDIVAVLDCRIVSVEPVTLGACVRRFRKGLGRGLGHVEDATAPEGEAGIGWGPTEARAALPDLLALREELTRIIAEAEMAAKVAA